MASGVEMLMKALGVNPEMFQQQATTLMQGVSEMVARQARIEQKLDRLLELAGDQRATAPEIIDLRPTPANVAGH